MNGQKLRKWSFHDFKYSIDVPGFGIVYHVFGCKHDVSLVINFDICLQDVIWYVVFFQLKTEIGWLIRTLLLPLTIGSSCQIRQVLQRWHWIVGSGNSFF